MGTLRNIRNILRCSSKPQHSVKMWIFFDRPQTKGFIGSDWLKVCREARNLIKKLLIFLLHGWKLDSERHMQSCNTMPWDSEGTALFTGLDRFINCDIYIFILLIVIKNKSCVNVTSFWINNSSCHESDPEDPTYGRLWPRKGKSVIDASRYAAYCANNMEVYPLTHLYTYGCNLDRSPN